MDYESMLVQAINRLDNISVPVTFTNQITIPIAQSKTLTRKDPKTSNK